MSGSGKGNPVGHDANHIVFLWTCMSRENMDTNTVSPKFFYDMMRQFLPLIKILFHDQKSSVQCISQMLWRTLICLNYFLGEAVLNN